MSVKKVIFVAFIGVALFMASATALGIYALVSWHGGEQKKDDPTVLQGKWQAIAVETDGSAAPADFVKKFQWRFDKGFLMLKGNVPGGAEVPCQLTLDPTAKPKTLDYADFGTKQTVLGIYDLRGDQLEVCIITHPRERPSELKTAPGSKLTRITFARAK